jgi:hypothetical protein
VPLAARLPSNIWILGCRLRATGKQLLLVATSAAIFRIGFVVSSHWRRKNSSNARGGVSLPPSSHPCSYVSRSGPKTWIIFAFPRLSPQNRRFQGLRKGMYEAKRKFVRQMRTTRRQSPQCLPHVPRKVRIRHYSMRTWSKSLYRGEKSMRRSSWVGELLSKNGDGHYNTR